MGSHRDAVAALSRHRHGSAQCRPFDGAGGGERRLAHLYGRSHRLARSPRDRASASAGRLHRRSVLPRRDSARAGAGRVGSAATIHRQRRQQPRAVLRHVRSMGRWPEGAAAVDHGRDLAELSRQYVRSAVPLQRLVRFRRRLSNAAIGADGWRPLPPGGDLREIAELAPKARLVEKWKDAEADGTVATVVEFLRANTPGG